MAKGTTGKAFKQTAREALPEQQEILRGYAKERAELAKISEQYDKINAKSRQATTSAQDRIKYEKQLTKLLEEFNGGYSELQTNIRIANAGFEDQKKKIKALKSELTDYVDNFGELEGLQASITNQYGRQSVQAKSLEAIVDKTKAQYNGITSILNSNADIQGHQRDVILQALDTYKNFPVVLNGLEKQLKRNEITAEGFQDSIIKTEQGFQDLINQMDEMIPGIKEIKALLEALPGIMQKNAVAAAAMKKQFEGIDAMGAVGDFAMGGVAGGSGIVSHTADIGKNLISGTNVKALGFVGLGLAVIEFTAQMKGTQLAAAKATTAIEKATLENQLLQREIAIDLAHGLPGEEAMIKFKYELQKLVAEFSKSSQTTLFGGALGEMPYATDQMQLAGIGAESVVSAMNDLSKTANIGIFPQLAANAAVFAKKMGISTSELGTQIGLYRRLNKVGGGEANTGVQASISTGVIDPTTFSSDMADASKMAMFYNIKSYEALSKQVKAVRMMGASFAEIGEAGKNMVLNYKDSIKSEMELSAMLGERVDLSEVRSLFASGQGDKAFEVLKSSGILEKAQAQGMFSMQALQSALQGMDLTQLGAAKYEGGQSVNSPSNTKFLESITSATAALNALTAVIQLQETGELGTFGVKKTTLERGDSGAMGIAANLITLDAVGFFREQLAKGAEFANFIGGQNGTSIPGVNPFGKGIDNVKNGKVVDSSSKVKGKTTTSTTPPSPSTGKGIDYLSQFQLQNTIQTEKDYSSSKLQNEQLQNLNSHTETSVELLKSLRDLTAIMIDPDRAKAFNVQLNMDGKQIHNVLIRKTENDKGSLKGGVTFATK